MGAVITARLKSATLVETIVAMVIILVLFSIATFVVVQTTAKGSSAQLLKAGSILNEYVLNTHDQNELFDQEILAGEFKIKRQVADYTDNNRLKKMSYFIFDANDKLLEKRSELLAGH